MSNNLKADLAESYQAMVNVLSQFQADESFLTTTVMMSQKMAQTFTQNRKIMVCGNGGSACQAMHFAEELTGRYRDDRKPLPALALLDSSHITCVGNDYGFESIFSRAVLAYAQEGDGLLVLSTSGNSANLIQAVTMAKAKDVCTYALLGRDGGKLKNQCDYEMIVPGISSDLIQNLHMMVIHSLIEGIERQLFPENFI